MSKEHEINIYGTRAFTSKFMPLASQRDAIRYDYDRFMIVRIEEIFPFVNEHVPPAKSLNDIILIITDGEAPMNIGTEYFIAGKKNVFYIPAGQIFSFEKYEDNKSTNGFLITFTKDILTYNFNNEENLPELNLSCFLGNPLIKMENESFGFAIQLLERILKENDEHGLTRLEIIRSYFVSFLLEIRNTSISKNLVYQSASLKLVRDFIEKVTVHIRQKKHVNEYALILNISPNYLSKVVKKFTNKSPIKWIDETLILEAKVLLFQTDMNINEISTNLGILDPSYFSRLFKKYEGKTPLSFRNEARKNK